jgi:hypothetical protein
MKRCKQQLLYCTQKNFYLSFLVCELVASVVQSMAQCTKRRAARNRLSFNRCHSKYEPLLYILALSLFAVRSDSPLLVASFRPPSVPIMGASASTNTMSTFALAQISRFGEHEMQGLLKQCTAIAKREGAEDHTIAASEYR